MKEKVKEKGSNLILHHEEIGVLALGKGLNCLVRYVEHPGARYHVMNGGMRRESILLGSDDYLSFLHVLEEGSVMWNVRMAAFCLIPNQCHLLVQTPDGFFEMEVCAASRWTGVMCHRAGRGRPTRPLSEL